MPFSAVTPALPSATPHARAACPHTYAYVASWTPCNVYVVADVREAVLAPQRNAAAAMRMFITATRAHSLTRAAPQRLYAVARPVNGRLRARYVSSLAATRISADSRATEHLLSSKRKARNNQCQLLRPPSPTHRKPPAHDPPFSSPFHSAEFRNSLPLASPMARSLRLGVVALFFLSCCARVSAQNRCSPQLEHSSRERSDGVNACRPCAPTYFSFRAHTFHCEQCPKGFGIDPYGLLCEQCQPGFYKNTTAFERCRPCPPGTYSWKRATSCIPCPRSTFSSGGGGTQSCKICPIGHYWHWISPTMYPECIRCPPGHSTSDTNLWQCTACKAGTHSHVEPDGTQRCIACPPGTFSQPASYKCTPCAPGTYNPQRGAPSCAKCPPRSNAWVRGMSFCVPHCARGSVRDGLPCVWCEKGYGRRGNVCSPCVSGTHSSRSIATECPQCPLHMLPNDDSTSCKCASGLLSIVRWGKLYCERCRDKHAHSPDGKQCVCVNGMQIDGSGNCRCLPGHKYVKAQCVRCSKWELAHLYDEKNSCETCAPGEGLYDRVCKKCPTGTANEYVNVAPCYKCPDGMEPRRGACRCKSGSEQIGARSCRVCQSGTFSDSVYEDCTSCSPGYYSSTSGASYCKKCPFWLTSWHGATYCRRHCPKHSYLTEGKCVCYPRYFWDGWRCRLCPMGRVADSTGLKCQCSPGRGWVKGRCQPCPAGTYSRGDYCKKCAPGAYSRPTTPWSCINCPPGTESLEWGSTKCTAKCGYGWFRDLNGRCTSCPKGSYAAERRCKPCPRGTVSAGGWTPSCVTCAPGKRPDAQRGACV